MTIVRAAITQTTWTGDKESMLDKHEQFARQAKEQGAPAYVAFTDATLMAIAEHVPSSERELALISGVGAMKLDKYGAAVLSLCAGEEPADDTADGLVGEPTEPA